MRSHGPESSAWVSSYGQEPLRVLVWAKDISARWLKASRALKKEDQIYGQRLAEMVKKHSSEAFYAFDDPWRLRCFRCWWR